MDDLSGGDTRLDGASIARLAVLTRVTLSLGDAAASTRLEIAPPAHTPDQAQQPWPPARAAEPAKPRPLQLARRSSPRSACLASRTCSSWASPSSP